MVGATPGRTDEGESTGSGGEPRTTEGGGAVNPTQADSSPPTPHEELAIEKREPSSWLGRLWDRPWRFAAAVFLVFTLFPFVTFLGISAAEGSLWLSGDANGFFEDLIFLSYGPVSFLGIMGVRFALERQYETLNSLWRRGLIRFESAADSTEDTLEHRSTLSRAEFESTVAFYDFLLSTVTLRGTAAPDCPPEYESAYHNFRRVAVVLSAAGLLGLAVGTYYHWNALAAYGVDIWASANYPLGFGARFVYEALLYVVVIPLLLTQLCVSFFLVYHPLKRLEETNGIQFRRFSPDEAGGFSRFGVQSFSNVLAMMPLAVPMGIYAVFYPTTPQIIASLSLFVVAVPTAFLVQLWRAHRAMAKLQEIELEILGEALTENYHLYKERLSSADSMTEVDDEKLVVHGEALEKADTVYNDIRKQPTWPFGRTQIGQVFSLMAFLVGIMISLI